MSRVLVTGGTGFVGANLARRLLTDGHDVHLLVRPAHDPWRIEAIRKYVGLHLASIEDEDGVGRVVHSVRPERVFHLAAHGAYSWQTSPREILSTNLGGTQVLLDACLKTGVEAFVNSGSSSEYGFQDHAPSETERLEPNSHYAVAKAAATQLCRFVARSRGVKIVTLRLYSIFGPWEDSRRFVPTLIREGLRGRLPPLVDPGTARDFVYVDDAVEAYVRAAFAPAREPGSVYNVGSGRQTTVRDAVDVARRVLGIAEEPQWGSLPARVWDTGCWVADARRILEELGWSAETGFEEGFRRTAATFSLPASIRTPRGSSSRSPAGRP